MKARTRRLPGLLATWLMLSVALNSTASAAGKNLNVTATTELTPEGAKLPAVSPENPAYYLVAEGGFIDAGDALAGEQVPRAADVNRLLQSVLAAHGYRAAGRGIAPTLLITTHWGIIRPVAPLRSLRTIDPNLRARLMLFMPLTQAERLEERVLDETNSFETNQKYTAMSKIRPADQTILDLADDAHYFVIVSAYDYPSLEKKEKKLLWSVRLRSRGIGDTMTRMIPTLANATGPYFGQALKKTEFIEPRVVVFRTRESMPDDPAASIMASKMANETAILQATLLLMLEKEAYAGLSSSAWEKMAEIIHPPKQKAERKKK